MRACVELAKDWRTDRYLRRLEAMMIVADADESLVLTGKGDVLEPDDNVMGIGSGGNYRARRGPRAARLRPRCGGDRAQSHGHCRRYLRLHQQAKSSSKACEFRKSQTAGYMTSFSPREIVSELDRYIIGQRDAKRAVAIALRNRWRRQQLDEELREEVLPKNILMIGPTGVGKTEISRRLAKLAGAPFIKVEATKFTEVGYVGRDVDQIIRDLVEAGIGLVRDAKRKEVEAKAQLNAEERVIDALVGAGATSVHARYLPQAPARRRARRQARSRSRSPIPAPACQPSRFPACRAARSA